MRRTAEAHRRIEVVHLSARMLSVHRWPAGVRSTESAAIVHSQQWYERCPARLCPHRANPSTYYASTCYASARSCCVTADCIYSSLRSLKNVLAPVQARASRTWKRRLAAAAAAACPPGPPHACQSVHARAHLRAELRRRDDEVDAHAKQHNNQARPREKALDAEAVLLATGRPDVGGVDWRVAVHVGAVLLLEAVHAAILACTAALRWTLLSSAGNGGKGEQTTVAPIADVISRRGAR